jgi:hypothetical protein
MSTPAGRNERLLRVLAAAQTPRQQEIAKRIYARLYAGDSVDDVKNLIEEMVRVIRQERQTDAGQPAGGQPSRDGAAG